MNRSQLSWYIGKPVWDCAYGMNGIVLDHTVVWKDTDGQDHAWDFDVLYEDGTVGYADVDDLEVITSDLKIDRRAKIQER